MQKTTEKKDTDLNDIMTMADNPEVIAFSGGLPDPALFPEKALAQAYQKAISQDRGVFQYHSAQGNLQLRQQLAKRCQKDGQINAQAENVLITQGGQQAITLIAEMVLSKGCGIAVESPTYLGALNVFDQYQPNYYQIPLDENGMEIDKLAEQLELHPEIKLIYTVPDFQNPTGTSMSLNRRKQLADLAAKYQVYVLEDSPYRDLTYTGSQLPTIKSFDQTGHVIFISSFSKILSPALRTGWVIAASDVIGKLTELKAASDLCSPEITQRSICCYLADNSLDQHIAQLCQNYQKKQKVMLKAIKDYFPSWAKATSPKGGFFIWVELPEKLDAGKLLIESVLPKYQVCYVPASAVYAGASKKNGFRLSYVGNSPDKIIEGIKRLGTCLKHV